MRRRRLSFALLPALFGAAVVHAQTHTIAKQESVVRAVGVYEWTGEEGKATASRFVPVSIFINGGLQDAGIYLARPTPFALLTGTVFEVRKAGEDVGTLEIAYARHIVGAGAGSYDDGWMAVGSFKIKPPEVFQATAKKSGPLPQIQVSGGKGPKLQNKTADADAAAKPVDRSGAAGSGTTVSAQDDPDRPTMRRRTDADATATKTSTDTSDDSKDVDRPTLRRRTPEQAKANSKAKQQASVSSEGNLNDDPDRPSLHRGKPVTRMEEDDLPPLHGIPADMHQRVAVSDAKDRPDHDFARAWDNEAQRVEVLSAMRQLAGRQLAGYGGVTTNLAAQKPAAVKPAAAKTARKPLTKAAAAPEAGFSDEDLRAYTLSYGGAATYEYQASSPGVDGAVRYVTVVAQRDPLGALQVALAKVTDAQHLDRTPWFRLVDVVDVEASNRASLLFELRGQTTRQFAVYRVIGSQAEQLFVTYPAQ